MTDKSISKALSDALEKIPNNQKETFVMETFGEKLQRYSWAVWFCLLVAAGCSFIFEAIKSSYQYSNMTSIFIGTICLCCAWLILRNNRF